MKIITYSDYKNNVPIGQDHVSREEIDSILTRFNIAVATNDFHYNSTEKRKYIYLSSSDKSIPKVIIEIVTEELTAAGWNVLIGGASCAHGGFNAIVITLP